MIKYYTLSVIFITSCLFTNAQTGTWTWMKGSNTLNSPGTFGTQGVPAASNEPPARGDGMAQWTDSTGIFWIYGGYCESQTGVLEDFWKFDVTTLMWTWMGGAQGTGGAAVYGTLGTFDAGNWPGPLAYAPATWVDKNNHLWVYGGINSNDAVSNLWQYDPGINQWAWMGGGKNVNDLAPVYGTLGSGSSSTTPGSRTEMGATWTDTANLWLFGGDPNRFVTGEGYNDLWRYNFATGFWTWMSGTDVLGSTGNYGTIGVPGTNYIPTGRCVSMAWQDVNGNFYLCGGFNFTSFWDDVWKFNPITLQWTWLSGSQAPVGPPATTPFCTPDTAYSFGGRYDFHAWKIADTIILTYGGFTIDFGNGVLNDVWGYIPAQNQWMELTNGSPAGNYGAQGVPASTNYPPQRFSGSGFVDNQNNIWHFGGRILSGGGGGSNFNDLWRYTIDSGCINLAPVTPPLQAQISSGNASCGACNGTATVSTSNGTPPFQYMWFPGNDTTATVQNLCAGLYYVTVTDSLGVTAGDSVLIGANGNIIVALGNDTAICSGQQLVLDAGNAGATYLWQDSSTAETLPVTTAGTYWVIVTTGTCSATDSISVTVNSTPQVNLGNDTSLCTGSVVLNAANAGDTYLWSTNATTQTITVSTAATYSVTVTNISECAASDTVIVNAYTLPPIIISSNNLNICPGDSAQICAPQGYKAYSWNIGDTSACVYVQISGNYYVTVTNNGCSAQSNHLAITVFQSSAISTNVRNDTFTAIGGVAWQWYLNGVPLSNDTLPVLIATQSGNYTVQVTDSNGCSGFSTPVQFAGISNVAAEDFEIYPNPLATGNWQLLVGASFIGTPFEIYDDNGRVVYSAVIHQIHSQIDLFVAPGIYIAAFTSARGRIVRKLVKL